MPLYGVNYRDRIDQALSFLDELGNPYDRIGRDDQARNGADWGVVAMPETFFHRRHRHRGPAFPRPGHGTRAARPDPPRAGGGRPRVAPPAGRRGGGELRQRAGARPLQGP